jgi:Family of unknown function (DUF5397)
MNLQRRFIPEPPRLVGTFRRFGVVGPVYEITAAGKETPDGDVAMRIRVVESGEELDYPYSAIIEDPKES